jgi:hypothetical protein
VPSEADPHGASSAVDDIRRAIDVAGGSLRFDEFMSLALYGPNGFYTGVGRAGRRGDFLTSPEVGPLFGTVLAAWIEAEFDRLGRPDDFEVIEVGAGPGTLARSILAHWRATSAVSHPYTAVEAGALQRAAHPEGVRSVGGLEERADRPITGVVLANELLDNLPFRLLVFDGRWRESHVTVASGEPGRLLEVLVPLADPPSWLPDAPPHGARVPWQQAARSWVETTIGSIAAGRYTSQLTTATAFLSCSFNRLASFAALVVLPEPCRPASNTTTGGWALKSRPTPASPMSSVSSSRTTRMSA